MQDRYYGRALHALGIPFTALLTVVFGMLLASFPIGVYVVFETEIGGDINYEYPVTHLSMFEGTPLYRAPTDVGIGDAFVALWILYAVLFVVAVLGPARGFRGSLMPTISLGRYELVSPGNYMVGVTMWLSVLVLASALINAVQGGLGIATVPPDAGNDLVWFFYATLAPVTEELGFRVALIGIPLYALYAGRPSARHFVGCLWNPSRSLSPNLAPAAEGGYGYARAAVLVVLAGALFGLAHVALGDPWSEGKLAQAAAAGVILGWVYIRYGFVAALLVHWATNYFVYSYANLVAQANVISVGDAFYHPLMASVEFLLLASGALSVAVLVACRLGSSRRRAGTGGEPAAPESEPS